MKKKLLACFMAIALGTQAQEVKEWLSLTPIPIEKPALSNFKNVKGQRMPCLPIIPALILRT